MSRVLAVLVALCALLAPSWAHGQGRLDARVPARALVGVESSAGARVGSFEFLQRDPEGFVDSVNVYAAMGNDPINNRDPTGRGVPIVAAAVLAIGVGGAYLAATTDCALLGDGNCFNRAASAGANFLSKLWNGRDEALAETAENTLREPTEALADRLRPNARFGANGVPLEMAYSKTELDRTARALGRYGYEQGRDAAVLGVVGAIESGGVSVGRPKRAPVARKRGGAGGGDMVTFYHGTTPQAAESIARDGFRPVSTNTHKHPEGSFFTYAADAASPKDPSFTGLNAATHMGSRHLNGGGLDVLEIKFRIPRSEYDDLVARGLAKTGPTPRFGDFPQETVFLPGALDVLNRSAVVRRGVSPQW